MVSGMWCAYTKTWKVVGRGSERLASGPDGVSSLGGRAGSPASTSMLNPILSGSVTVMVKLVFGLGMVGLVGLVSGVAAESESQLFEEESSEDEELLSREDTCAFQADFSFISALMTRIFTSSSFLRRLHVVLYVAFSASSSAILFSCWAMDLFCWEIVSFR